jgi:hypothetical protein
MAYPIVCNPCLDDDHPHCLEKDDDEHQKRLARVRAGIVGGSFCICRVCNPKVDSAWYNEVKTRSEEARKR